MRTTAMLKEARDTFEDVRTADGKGRVALGARFDGRREPLPFNGDRRSTPLALWRG